MPGRGKKEPGARTRAGTGAGAGDGGDNWIADMID
jgi:hypothetical protein